MGVQGVKRFSFPSCVLFTSPTCLMPYSFTPARDTHWTWSTALQSIALIVFLFCQRNQMKFQFHAFFSPNNWYLNLTRCSPLTSPCPGMWAVQRVKASSLPFYSISNPNWAEHLFSRLLSLSGRQKNGANCLEWNFNFLHKAFLSLFPFGLCRCCCCFVYIRESTPLDRKLPQPVEFIST